MSTTDIKNKWRKNWDEWDNKARSILKQNAEECDVLSKKDKMMCIMNKNENVSKKHINP